MFETIIPELQQVVKDEPNFFQKGAMVRTRCWQLFKETGDTLIGEFLKLHPNDYNLGSFLVYGKVTPL